ncbi:hypothetical protein LCGC14_2657330, partial [marine sediment metagenome]
MKFYSLKEKSYSILENLCEKHFQNVKISFIIIDRKLDNSYTLPFNLDEENSVIIIPYISKPSLIINQLKIIDIDFEKGEYVHTKNKLKLDIKSYKIFNIKDFKSLIDYIDVETGKILGSAFSYKITNGFLTIITTIELFLLNKIELEKKYKQIFEYVINEYNKLTDLSQKSRKFKDKLIIEHLFNGNPFPILISQFEENQIGKKEFWSKWEKLESFTKMFSKKVLISTINKLIKFEFLKEDEKDYII